MAQQPIQKGWHLLDEEQDGYYGISLQKAYDFLKGRKSQTIVVAVIDSGIDTTHEDLKPILWRNTKDNNANGIDDDKNGYPDDALGWNFLGNRKGENVEKESAEAARLFHALAPQFDNRQIDSNLLSPQAKADFRLWLQVQKAVAVTEEDRFILKIMNATSRTMLQYDSIIAAQWGKNEFTPIELETFIPQSPEARKAKLNLLRIYTLLQVEPEQTNVEFMEGMREFIQQKEDIIYLREKQTTNYRLQITGDDENNWQSRNYGNADVMAGTAMHGTHVAGIIAGELKPGMRTKIATAVSRVRDHQGGESYEPWPIDRIVGVAPECKLLSLKVLDRRGRDSGRASNILAALAYINELNAYGRNIQIHGVNLSVGYEFEAEWFGCGQSPLCTEVNRLVSSGVVVVAAAGNTGYGSVAPSAGGPNMAGLSLTINDPGNAERAITVGSVDSTTKCTA